MRVTRVYTDQPLAVGRLLALEEAPARHIRTVLRLRAGDEMILFDGSGTDFRARLTLVAREAVEAETLEAVRTEPEARLPITLVQAVAKGEHMDYALQKAVELGISRFVPVFTQHGVVRLQGERLTRKREHWRRVAIGACEQSGRTRLPEIGRAQPLEAWLAEPAEATTRLVLDPGAKHSLKDINAPSGEVQCLIGPEGGLSGAEVDLARAAGFQPIRLGPRTLRTETAASAVVTAIQILWGDLAG